MKQTDIKMLLQLIDKAPKQVINSTNILDDPVRIYFTIKALYQKYKSKNMIEAMQENIFEVTPPTMHQKICYNTTPVTVKTIFQHDRLSQNDILRFIDMKSFLSQQEDDEIDQQIITSINSLKNIKEVLNCFRTLMSKEYSYGKMSYYYLIQEKMIQKVLAMQIINKDFKIIARHIFSLPIITQSILVFISQLYERIIQISDFKELFIIFEANYPCKPTQIDIQALIRICNDQTLAAFIKIIQNKDEQSQIALQIAEKIAKQKLTTLSGEMTQKSKLVLKFIVHVAKYGCSIWNQIIQWQKIATIECKQFLQENLGGFLIQSIRKSQNFAIILDIAHKLTATNAQSSVIDAIVTKELFNLENRQILSHKIIRKYLAKTILKEFNPAHIKILFQINFVFIEIILQIFNFKPITIKQFYFNIMNNNQTQQLRQPFYKFLAQGMPVKFKEIFRKWNGLKIIDHAINRLAISEMNYFIAIMSFDIAIGIIRDLACDPPTLHLLSIFDQFLQKFTAPQQSIILKQQIVRTLNIILTRLTKNDLHHTFKVKLPAFIENGFKDQKQRIFQNVSIEMTSDLKKVYDENARKKNA